MVGQKASGIAIRFGGTSNGPSSSPRPTPSTALGKRHRAQFDNDSDSDGDEPEDAQHENITHFGANGAEFVDDERSRRVQSESDDRDKERRRTGSPGNEGHQKHAKSEKFGKVEEEEPLKYGLTVSKSAKNGSKDDGNAREEDDDKDGSRPPKTVDEEAMDALMGEDSGKQRLLHRTEEQAYRESAASAPDVDDVATYDAFPVEGFGEALLKGQGWDGKMRGPKAKEISKRPNGMGLGAKKLNAEEDLGAWDHKGKGKREKRPRLDEYRREKDRERTRREDRHSDSYKNERDRERGRPRDRDRERDRDRDRDHDSYRNRDRDSRR